MYKGRGGSSEKATYEIVGCHGSGWGGVVEVYEEDVHDIIGGCYEEGDDKEEEEDDGEGRAEGEEESVGEDCGCCEDLFVSWLIVDVLVDVDNFVGIRAGVVSG